MIYTKPIKNKYPHTWLDWIEKGSKKYEGRLNKEFWSSVKEQDIFIWKDENGKEVKTEIVKIRKYKSFSEAFKELGSDLVPIEGITSEEVEKIYSDIYKDDINKYDVLALQLRVIL